MSRRARSRAAAVAAKHIALVPMGDEPDEEDHPVTTVTLHFKASVLSRECAVCGTRLDRSERDGWWLRNTWTSVVRDYAEGPGHMPADWFRPCGTLPASQAPAKDAA